MLLHKPELGAIRTIVQELLKITADSEWKGKGAREYPWHCLHPVRVVHLTDPADKQFWRYGCQFLSSFLTPHTEIKYEIESLK
jgi:hypothetical protein